MKPATRQLHLALLRAAKSAIAAWETWVNADRYTNDPPPVTTDPPPVTNDPPRAA